MNILRVRCRNLDEFDEYYLPDLPNGGAFCPIGTHECLAGLPAATVSAAAQALLGRAGLVQYAGSAA